MIAVVDYGMGNLHSVLFKLRYLGAEAKIVVSPEELAGAERIILPGVGHFAEGIRQLNQSGMREALEDAVSVREIPLLGICLGAQLICRCSEEGGCTGLGWIDADVVRFDQSELPDRLKVPHMGWNTLRTMRDTALLDGVGGDDYFYFVHSFHLNNVSEEQAVAVTEYGYPFVAVVNKGNVWGTQFHPEKSHHCGLDVLDNFLEL